MTHQNIAVIGSASQDFVDYAVENNIYYTIFTDSRREVKTPHDIICNFSSVDALFEVIQAQNNTYTAVLTFYEEYIVVTSHIAQKLHVQGLTPQAAINCTDKTYMRAAFLQSPMHISPQFKIVESLDDAIEFGKKYGYPLMLKPASLAKSLLVTKITSEKELQEQYFKVNDLLQSTYLKYAPRNEPKLLVEEFLEGSIHSIDAFVDKHGKPYVLQHIVDYQTGYDIGFNDNFHYSRIMPSKLSPHQQQELKSCAEAGITALGMTSSAAHIEIIMTKKGPRIVEIGARNGGYRQKMHLSAHGINLYQNYLALLHDQPLHLTPLRDDPCAVLELFPRSAGVFEGIHMHEQLEELPSLRYLNIRAKQGALIGTSGEGYKAAAVIMLHNEDVKQFNKDLAFVNDNVFVKTS